MPNELLTNLPTGTVTFLFTDIEGSTQLLHELGAEPYAAALDRHRQLLRAAFAAHGGVEVDTEGDAFFVAFSDAGAAVAAAEAAQAALGAGPIKVRMGLHTGRPLRTEQGYVGVDVHKGARIAAAAHGGQVVLSKPTRDSLAGRFVLLDLGEHRLKDFAEPTWIYQLGAARFPPLKTISNTNLPHPTSSFIGRSREVGEIGGLLRDGTRFVTLTGPGGTGKTRLAIEAATELVPAFKNGVFWVGLSALRDPALVPETIGRTLGAKGGVADHIGEREMLLLLDNLEQVSGAAGELASLAEACPNLRLLVTSRERLRVRGEVEYAVPPLADSDAVALFCERARLEPEPAVMELCRRLDDLPLAVELAAARTSVLAPAQILERLGQRLDLLKGGRDADPRQATLRATIEWSHDLLDSHEQSLYRRLSVFRGGCTLEAAEMVCDADLDTLGALVDKSLVQQREERFAMLETIREFAAERLERSGDSSELRRRHATFFAQLAERAEPHLMADEIDWFDRLEKENDNLRASFDVLEATGDTQALLDLAGRLQRFWYLKGHLTEGRRRFEAALARDKSPTEARARALRGASVMALNLGDTATSLSWAEEALEIDRALSDPWGEAYSLMMIGNSFGESGDVVAGRPFIRQAMTAFEQLGDELYALIALVNLAWMTEEIDGAAAALALHEQLLRRAKVIGNSRMTASALESLAFYARDEGRLDEAVAMYREAIAIHNARGNALDLAFAFGRLASTLVRMGKAIEAAQLLGASEALLLSIGHAPAWWEARRNDETVALIDGQLSESERAKATEKGRRMPVADAVKLAMGGSDAQGAAG